ncbi:unnamed protein product [Linum trigynum]|uniref:Retrotransposon Copia-like N-terminal domain-containing protein n=1 Tax=Linum trigynum TaxID=586398 RepID=A0AAV2CSG7_9ROSI
MSLDGEEPQGSPSGGATIKVEESLPSVYLLSPSDGPGNLLVGDVLTASNFSEWVLDMKDALIAKNKYCFVDGSLLKPTNASEKAAWIRCDAMVNGWLKASMDKEIRSSIRFAEHAAEIWANLQERFGKGSSSRAYELRHLISLLQQDKNTVSSFYTRLRGYWEEISQIAPLPSCVCGICTCGVSKKVREQQDTARLFEFLMGLDETFSAIRSQILASRPVPALSEAFHMLLNEEQQ